MLGLEVYETESSEWQRFTSIQRFRHSSWLVDTFLYVYGGFELDSPNIPTDTITKINLVDLFKKHPNILDRIFTNAKKNDYSPPHSPILPGEQLGQTRGVANTNQIGTQGRFSPKLA